MALFFQPWPSAPGRPLADFSATVQNGMMTQAVAVLCLGAGWKEEALGAS